MLRFTLVLFLLSLCQLEVTRGGPLGDWKCPQNTSACRNHCDYGRKWFPGTKCFKCACFDPCEDYDQCPDGQVCQPEVADQCAVQPCIPPYVPTCVPEVDNSTVAPCPEDGKPCNIRCAWGLKWYPGTECQKCECYDPCEDYDGCDDGEVCHPHLAECRSTSCIPPYIPTCVKQDVTPQPAQNSSLLPTPTVCPVETDRCNTTCDYGRKWIPGTECLTCECYDPCDGYEGCEDGEICLRDTVNCFRFPCIPPSFARCVPQATVAPVQNSTSLTPVTTHNSNCSDEMMVCKLFCEGGFKWYPGTECLKCECYDPCEDGDIDVHCGDGRVCRPRLIECLQYPCIPPSVPQCVLLNSSVGQEQISSTTPTPQKCPEESEPCNITCDYGQKWYPGTECLKCECYDPCKDDADNDKDDTHGKDDDGPCEDGQVCEPRLVQCFRFPCIPPSVAECLSNNASTDQPVEETTANGQIPE